MENLFNEDGEYVCILGNNKMADDDEVMKDILSSQKWIELTAWKWKRRFSMLKELVCSHHLFAYLLLT
jgi:hypothetical protein